MTRSATYVTSLPGATFLGSIVRAIADIAKALQHRREIVHLAEFDDRMLKDIGLIRSDVEGALAESLLHNPSRVLVRCAERHTRSERMAAPVRSARPVVPLVKSVAA
ncbi:DUF1127 domain-containing protein [Microvirga puerhi]|uniref:DUF1127 domain-containing protein n=1 Tax=Microvirga puerhi TaxID=2876078 RepID=A0ABS7VKG5_9HYPH|nr:DUF1127 domain-containing protein [Microvirga puerhi]MBZ6076022.1 DUF1127 domain-containing protein [Microvirga puerhi]